jgi:hypothetical protein
MKKRIKKDKNRTKFWLILLVSLAGGISGLTALLYLIPQPNYKTGFKTIKDLEMLAATRDEWIKMEGVNPLIPSYENYYLRASKRSLATIIYEKARWLRTCFSAGTAPFFSPSYFKTLLEQVTKVRLAQKWQGDFIQKIQLTPESKVISFGVLQGAFHSFVRCLRELQKLQILDENLKLMSNEYYISFNGNLINRSPYTLEILSAVMKLMEVNPRNIFYLRSEHEYFDEWRLHSLKRELEVFCRQLSPQEIPLKEEIESFFGTLPLALYCTIPFQATEKLPYFRINPFFITKHLTDAINEASYANFIKATDNGGVATMSLSGRSLKPEEAAHAIQLKAIITEIRKRDKWEIMDGLRQLQSIDGAVAWHIFSSPTQIFREFLHFYWDAFVVITPGLALDKWTITLHHHDVRNQNDSNFSIRAHYFFGGGQV